MNTETKLKKLAIDGGEPIRTKPLPWELPGAEWINSEEKTLVDQVINAKSPFRYYGPDLQHMVDTLEKEVCDKFGIPFALGVNSGSAALLIVLAAAEVGPGDEVLVPGYMWVSCLSAIVRLGAIPKLVDIDDTFCMNPKDLKNKITEHSKAILCVNMSGAPGHIKDIAKIAKENNLFLLEDCAQATNSKQDGQYAGTFGDAAIFSFQLNKNMTSGEGGMILCQDEHIYKRCFAIHDLGYARNDAGRLDLSDPEYQLWGVGSRMSELTGACALAQLRKLDEITGAMRTAKWEIRDSIKDINGLEFRNVLDPSGDSGPFLITVYPTEAIAQQFMKALKAEGINGPEGSLACLPMSEWGLHWYSNNLSLVNKRSLCSDGFPWTHPANSFAKDYDYSAGSLPYCDDMMKRAGIMSVASTLTDQDVQDIIDTYHKVAGCLL